MAADKETRAKRKAWAEEALKAGFPPQHLAGSRQRTFIAEMYDRHGSEAHPSTIRSWVQFETAKRDEGKENFLPDWSLYKPPEPTTFPTDSVPKGHKVKGVSTLYNADGTVTAQWVKTVSEADIEEVCASIREAFAEFKGAARKVTPPKDANHDLATIYPAADWHLNLLSWHKETGHNYDLKIATQTVNDCMERLIQMSPASSVAVILGLGDMMHSDGYANLTTRSKNILDVDSRYPKAMKAAVTLLISTIDMALQKHERVVVRILPGNHDDETAIAIALALSMYYHGHDRVTVDDDPGRFWWWQWGKVLLGATHGDMAKMKDLPLIMASRNPKAWGTSKFRHIYTGHIHQQTGLDMSGVTVESFRTPAAPDAWQSDMGYTPGRSVTAITHHKEYGEIGRHRVNIV